MLFKSSFSWPTGSAQCILANLLRKEGRKKGEGKEGGREGTMEGESIYLHFVFHSQGSDAEI